VTRVALVAPSRLALEHLALLLQHDHHLTIVARSARLESLTDRAWATRADVALVAVDEGTRLRAVLVDVDGSVPAPPLVVLIDARSRTDVSALVERGVKGVLPPDAGPREVAAALEAVAAGLTVLAPAALSALRERTDHARVAAGAPRATPHAPLSPREREILALVAEGLGNKIVAARLGISEHTVKTHVTSIFEKLGAESRAEAVAIGARTGVILL
jgi:DNA-binding NarL/FixJ family response regulator